MESTMSVHQRIRAAMTVLFRDERGIAVPTALMALVASFALASVAVMSTLDVQQGTKRDHDSKEAIAAADAGANIALLRLNRFLPSLSAAHPCIGPSGEYQTASGGWCPSTLAEPVGGAVYSYRVSAYTGAGAVNVVSVGSSGTVGRRVNVSLNSINGKNVFADEKLIGQDEITLNGNFKIETDIGTNGNIIQNGGSGTICGDDRHGVGKEAPAPSCDGVKTEENRNLPLVTPPANIATENSNCMLAQKCTTGPYVGKVDTYSKKVDKNSPWDAEHRAINVSSQATLTMNGNDYWVCEVNIGAGKLYMSVGAHVRIFVDTPEHCGLPSGATQVTIGGNANIESSPYNTSQGLFEVPGIYVVGNGAVKLDGGSGANNLILYAPLSNIEMKGNATWIGMIAGRTLNLSGNPLVKSDSNIKEPNLPLSSRFQRTRYVECTGAAASPPNASC
jgi:hypothetical protein